MKEYRSKEAIDSLSKFNASEFLVEKDIYRDIELYAKVIAKKKEGSADLATLVRIQSTCKMHTVKRNHRAREEVEKRTVVTSHILITVTLIITATLCHNFWSHLIIIILKFVKHSPFATLCTKFFQKDPKR